MPRIRCHYIDCILLDDGYCGAAAVEMDPDVGCMTYKRSNDLEIQEDVWEDDEADELDEWDDVEDDEEELWMDDDEDF